MLKRVATFVESRLQIVHSPESMPDASTQAQNREDNKRFLFALCFAGVHPGRYRDMLEKNADQLLDDVGGLPWAQDATAMKLLCTSAACAGHGHDEPCQCGDEHRFRVATHIKVLFFRRQPMLAAQSRWTGIPNAAAWFVGPMLFQQMLQFLLQAQEAEKLETELVDGVPHANLDVDLQSADANMVRAQQRLRSSLFAEWLTSGTSALQCLLIVYTNRPVRELLKFLFKHSSLTWDSADPAKLNLLWQRYLLDGRPEDEMDRGGPRVTGFSTWSTGRVTESSLIELCSILLGKDSQEASASIARLVGATETVFGFIRRSVVVGASAVWWRLHQPTGQFPMMLFKLVSQATSEAECADILRLLIAKSCGRSCHRCLDPGFSTPIGRWCLDLASELFPDVAPQDLEQEHLGQLVAAVKPLIKATADAAILGTFGVEIEHGDMHKDVKSSVNAGMAKALPTLSSNHVLRGARARHTQALRSQGLLAGAKASLGRSKYKRCSRIRPLLAIRKRKQKTYRL
jgi:hypothetical protein